MADTPQPEVSTPPDSDDESHPLDASKPEKHARWGGVVVEEGDKMVLDYTGHETPAADEELDPDVTEVDFTNTRLRQFPENILKLRKLETLTMRQNLLTTTVCYTAFQQLPISLTYLDMHLDLSFNKIRGIENVSQLVELRQLFYCNNRIQVITPELLTLTNLVYLELGSNRIQTIENLHTLTNLRHLWLGRNKIRQIDGLRNLVNLRRLDVQNNRLAKLQGLETLIHLEELYVGHNGLTSLEGLDSLKNLQILDISGNQIGTIEPVSALSSLEEFWASSNNVLSFDELDHLKNLEVLNTVYFEHNPIYGDKFYRKIVAEKLPRLTQIDASPVLKVGGPM